MSHMCVCVLGVKKVGEKEIQLDSSWFVRHFTNNNNNNNNSILHLNCNKSKSM